MKLLNEHRIVAFIILMTWSTATANGTNTIHYFFPKKFGNLMLKSKLKIVRVKNVDGFGLPLHICLKGFYKDTLGVETYDLADREGINKIGVSEYVFKDTLAALRAFQLAYPYAESVRKTRLKDWSTMCFNVAEVPLVYYVSRDGAHIYLYTTVYNFSYKSVEGSVDMSMKNDKKILLDDLYREMTGSKL